MPILRVLKNDKHLCTVGSDDVWMFSASVWGDIWGPEVSFWDVSGGSKRRPDGESDFLIWEMPLELEKADHVAFSFEDGSISSPKGTAFDPETCPSKEQKMEISFPPTAEDLIKLESRPALNAGLTWEFFINGTLKVALGPDTTRQHVSLQVLWNEDHPERLRVNLSKKSLREIFNRSGGENLFLDFVPLGTRFEIAVGV